MKKTVIHQFHSGSAYGDAVTNSMLLIRRMLLRFGFVSKIFVERVVPELKEDLVPHNKLKLKKDDILLVHHSMGHDLADWVMNLPGKKILVYHNITPEYFFPKDSPYRYYARLGREQLNAFLPVMDASICVSRLNADELKHLGYTNVKELPLLIDTDAIQNRKWDEALVSEASGFYTILFVGRVCPNKCQEDLITIALHLKTMLIRPFQLVLVGGYSEMDPYYIKLSALVRSAGLNDQVRFTGKIPDSELYGWYRAADLFLCMSEHEGFGVPLIEAMAFDVPVMAFKSSNVPYTLGNAGILVTQKDHRRLAALIKILSRDHAMQRALIQDQQRHAAHFTENRLSQQLYGFLEEQGIDVPEFEIRPHCHKSVPLQYQVEGPFESSYSLALVNREVALALDRKNPGKVGLFATEGPGDYEPDPAAIRSLPGVETLWKKGRKASRAGVVIRNLYPPRVADMDGRINLLYFAWEESMLPFEWTQSFNRHLDGLPVLSKFIKKILVDNGVHLPITAAGCGIDHIQQRGQEQISQGQISNLSPDVYKFLHISSCFPRKGADLLLEAFASTFTSKDDVGLVIKTFPNIHNTIEEQVKEIKKRFPDSPPIEIINKDLCASQIAGLYRQCDALVAPSRGEGFGLPMAEAMWHKLPVITTAYGGQSDFCTPDTSWLIDFTFQAAETHMDLFNSVWMEPDVEHLGKLMAQVRLAKQEQLKPRLDAALELIQRLFTWDQCADRLTALEQKICRTKPLCPQKIRLGWVSSWKAKCGIATYSKFLTDALPKEDFHIKIFASNSDNVSELDTADVFRCWTDCTGNVESLLAAMATANLDALVVQFSFAFFRADHLKKIISFAKEKGIVLIIFFHATKDVNLPGFQASLAPATDALATVDRLLVHGLEDLNRFKSRGIYKNTTVFPHGVFNRGQILPGGQISNLSLKSQTIIASYGFMLPHKGLEQLIQAFSVLRKTRSDVHLLMVNALYPDRVSDETKLRCSELIKQHRLHNCVTLITEFLEDEKSFALLDTAAMVVFPYQETAESASGAVRYGIATRRPVVCTPLEIFSDVRDIVHFLPGTSSGDIAAGIEHLFLNPDLLKNRQNLQERWLAAHSWDVLGKRLGGMVKGLCRERIDRGRI
ncbi:glycosyltransferase [Desulfobacula phenolica]|uniref:Glycosyltransferase involved in cell wall bisynthesis n=1 Tax=Desulfobacula phenolica TaxID=90732 RepID=A0A1H2DPL6_9BACT|nr:glycosyltransferase [Desulfobacula phenolica]SDT84681.1 Glycosyltransferase involved in cell wall bisynthesis [Desulfobacula phenolica]